MGDALGFKCLKRKRCLEKCPFVKTKGVLIDVMVMETINVFLSTEMTSL